jgi:AcrR family transcriptional regulator
VATNRQTTRLGAEERRQQLLSAGLTTFGRKGFVATSMNDVALEAGVTKPVLYQHFDSKHFLYLELLNTVGQTLVGHMTTAAATAGSPREQVERTFAAYFHFFADEPGHFTVLYGEGVRSDPSFTSELIAVEDAAAALTADYIEIEGLTREDRLLLARAIGGMLESSVRRWIQEGERRDPDEAAALIAELAWRGLRGVKPNR